MPEVEAAGFGSVTMLGPAHVRAQLRAQAPVGLCTAAVAIAVAGTLLCTLWVGLLFGVAPILRGATG